VVSKFLIRGQQRDFFIYFPPAIIKKMSMEIQTDSEILAHILFSEQKEI
jgi:hypothetical protein